MTVIVIQLISTLQSPYRIFDQKHQVSLIKYNLPVRAEVQARSQFVSLSNSSQYMFDTTSLIQSGATMRQWISHWAHTVTSHREDVYTDCLPYWLHPEYQSSAAAAGRHPSGRSWQLSAGACPLSGRREGGKQLTSKSVWLWAFLQVWHKYEHKWL